MTHTRAKVWTAAPSETDTATTVVTFVELEVVQETADGNPWDTLVQYGADAPFLRACSDGEGNYFAVDSAPWLCLDSEGYEFGECEKCATVPGDGPYVVNGVRTLTDAERRAELARLADGTPLGAYYAAQAVRS